MKRGGTSFATMTNVLTTIYGLSPTTYKLLPTLLLTTTFPTHQKIVYHHVAMSLESKTTYLHFYASKEQKNLFNFSINPHIVISSF
jgi:hypothetical protein